MKKSTAYRMAQIAVLDCPTIMSEDKLRILAVLLEDEDLAVYQERQERKEQADSETEK